MAGKRLLDAVKLLNAGRSIGKQHFLLRQEQLDVYSKTSTLAKAAKEQTDRVTVTLGAAYELAKRFNEPGPSWQQERSERSGEDSADGYEVQNQPLAGKQKTHSTRGSVAVDVEQEWTGNLKRDKEKHDDGSLSSLRRREIQRQAEKQIPAATAETQPSVDQRIDQDSFTERTEAISPGLSSLPRTKIPKHPEGPLIGNEQTLERSLNQDVFYTPDSNAETAKAEELPEGVSIDGLFTSARVSRSLGETGSNVQKPHGRREKLPPKPLPEMLAAERQRKGQEEKLQNSDVSSSIRSMSESGGGDAETHRLVESIAQEAAPQSESSSTTGVQTSGSETPYAMRESRVPASRLGRLWQYGGLATSMAFGAVGESFRRLAGGSNEGSLMLSESNMNRLVARLSRMRGAALKLGQMLSIQDSKSLPPIVNAVLQRVQDSADYMPSSQRDKVLVGNLGPNWRALFSNFEEKPFAAASIGQVHKATLSSNNKDVAVKVQYPGVRNSIDSDLSNLSLLLTASQLLPKGLFLDRTIANARVELAWECDYEREAQACIRFAQLLEDERNTFTVPKIYAEASGPGVLTAEFMTGTPATKIKDLAQTDRDWLGTQILRLCLRELMEWRFMQTDPNWTNFLYNRESQKLELLDFGASRDFPDKFVEPYVNLLIAASKGDRERCRDLSIELGYLTGRESREMLNAHIDSIFTLAEPFVENAPDIYDFKDQTITDRVRANIGLMLRERLAPPPEETYSLHRKLSGAFLLCARLRSRVRAREMFARAVGVWDGRLAKLGEHAEH